METRESDGSINLPGRIMSIDLGKARVGIALSDPNGILATPYSTIKRVSEEVLLKQIMAIADEYEVSLIVIAIPKSLSEKNVIAENETKLFMDQVASRTKRRVIGVDERFTTVLASQRLRELGHDAKSMKLKIDATAAAEILQSYLDSRVKYQ